MGCLFDLDIFFIFYFMQQTTRTIENKQRKKYLSNKQLNYFQ